MNTETEATDVSRDTLRKQLCACGEVAAAGQRLCLSCHAAYMRDWRKTHRLEGIQKLRSICRAYLNVYLRRGKITRGPCREKDETCRGPVEAHHADYKKPLAVQWLCRSHHIRLECELSGKVSRVYA